MKTTYTTLAPTSFVKKLLALSYFQFCYKSKRIIFFLVSTLFLLTGYSQNFCCLNSNTHSFFENGQQLKVIAIDTVVNAGEDLVYYNYTTLEEIEQYNCYALNGPSWIGLHMIAKPNGDNVFYNLDDKSIIIKTLSDVGDYWICYEFFTGYYIRAAVTEAQNMGFLGITDMVKKITFQAMGSNGQPVVHPVNDMYLLLSENYGLIRTVNFKVFPDLIDYTWEEECQEFELCGMDNPAVGQTNLTKEQIFNLNVGDEYHTKRYSDPFSGFYDEQYMIYTIIHKTVSLNGDTILYQAARCGKKGEIVNNVVKWQYYNDTIQFLINLPDYNFLDTIPEWIMVEGDEDYREYSYNTQEKLEGSDRMLKRYWNGLYSVSPHDCIEMIITDEKNPGYGEQYYVEGIGGPFYNYDFWWPNYYHLVYFNMGEEEWGEPYNCDSLLVHVEQSRTMELKVRVVPNPMTTKASITFYNPENESYVLRLYNFLGHQIKEFCTTSNTIQLQRDNLQGGVYFYSLYKENIRESSGTLIIN